MDDHTLNWNISEDLDIDMDVFSDKSEESLTVIFDKFTPIPIVPRAVITVCIVLLTAVSNALIFKHYYKSKTSNRPYVLALVYLDFILVVVGLIPRFILTLFETTKTIETLLYVNYALTMMIFSLYFCPPMFLGLDRFLAVTLPHNFFQFKTKARVVKVLLALSMLCALSGKYLSENLYGARARISGIFRATIWVICYTAICVTILLYIFIASKMLRRNGKFSTRHLSK